MKVFCEDISEIKWEKHPAFILNQSVHVWLVDVENDSKIISELKKVLNDDELKRADRFAFEKDRNQFITAHGALREIIAKYSGINASKIQFKRTLSRKPFISFPQTNLQFNISHSGNKILVGISEEEIGVDIEIMKDQFEFGELSKAYFSEKEQNKINASINPQATFLKFWTCKEALLKAAGTGISEEIKNIIVCDDVNNSSLPSDYFVTSLMHENFVAAIVRKNVGHNIIFRSFN